MSLALLTTEPVECTLLKQYKLELAWTPEKHYPAGSHVEFRVRSLRSFIAWNFFGITMDGADVLYRWKVNPSVSEVFINKTRAILRARLTYGAREGTPIILRLQVLPSEWAGVNLDLATWVSPPKSEFSKDQEDPPAEEEAGSQCSVMIVAGPVGRVSVYARPLAGVDGSVRVLVVPEDRFGNPARFEEDVEATLTWNGTTQPVLLRSTTECLLPPADDVMRPRVAVPMSALGVRENVANGVRDGANLVVEGNPVLPSAIDSLMPAYGEFHWHTQFSGDGARPFFEALREARDHMNMDYVAPGDHNPRGEAWDRTVSELDTFNAPDSFATFYGWEDGSNVGHWNFYFLDPKHPARCGGEADIIGGGPLPNTPKIEGLKGLLAIPHHTNAVAEVRNQETGAPFWHPYPWDDPHPAVRLVEIMQTRGNQECECYDDAWRGWHQFNGGSVQEALARGHHIGFTGGTDNHCGYPGRAFFLHEGGGRHNPYSVILTGVWTERITRESVFDSLMARHTWAVWDTRAIVYFTVNDVLGGGELSAAKGDSLTARIRVWAEDVYQTVEIVSEGKVVWQSSFAERDIDVTVELDPASASTHFYLRGLLRNGGIFYASPVFVTVE